MRRCANKCWHLVRDQEVEGSNPFAPTICFQVFATFRLARKSTTWLSARCSSKNLQQKSILMEEAGCNHLLKNNHSEARLEAVFLLWKMATCYRRSTVNGNRLYC